jgi:hypothetical protein
MLNQICVVVTFLIALFVLFNGPLWLTTRLHIFNRGKEAPSRLTTTVIYISRLLGLVGLVTWLVKVNQDNASNILLYGVLLVCGILLLFNIPVHLVSRISVLKGGKQASAHLLGGYLWFSRIAGLAIIICVPTFILWLR